MDIWNGVPKHPVWSAAIFEYWEQGDRYRISARAPLSSNLSQFSDIAWDGVHRYLYIRDAGMLTIGSRDFRMSPAPLRNPLFLAASFLGVGVFGDQTCPLCELRLSDLRATQPTPTLDSGWGSAAGKVTLPGPAGSPATFRVSRWGHPRDSSAVIDQLNADGELVAEVHLQNFNPVPEEPGLLIPWTVAYEIRQGGKPQIRFTYKIELLEVNEEISAGTFRIPIEPSMLVWDEDAKTRLQ